MSAQDVTSSAARRRWFITVLLAMVILAVVAGIALSRSRDTEAATGLGTSPTATTSLAAPSVAASDPASAPAATGTQTSRSVPTRKVTTSTAPATTAPAGPSIAYFRVATKPSCPSGTDQVRYEGQPVVLEWKATGADKTTLSVDGPGIYDEYGATGSATLNFPCSGDPGSFQTHTYTLKAIGPDGTKSKTLTVKAKVNEIATT
ncbi:hypothetical protein [Actinoplanes regularis]|uniref:hypothetical protein n=1 Tax=Actinoplanes regularis TaxID=52697 RepID=UPI0025566422|nr:hypothetical protein [Actinoplanes regularis]